MRKLNVKLTPLILGADHVWAGAGNDIAFGEGGNDTNDSEWRIAA